MYIAGKINQIDKPQVAYKMIARILSKVGEIIRESYLRFMDQSPEERKAFLAELNKIALYTAKVLQGEDVPKGRVKQYKKYFNKTYKMIHRLASMKGDINNSSFKYGYGGKILVRRVMLELGVVKKKPSFQKRATYILMVSPDEITLELVSRIIVEVYLIRNDVEPL